MGEFEIIELGSDEGIAGNLCVCNGLCIQKCFINILSICPCVAGGYCEGNCVCH